MARESKTWTLETADGAHIVEFFPRTAFKPAKLMIDGSIAPLDMTRSFYEGIDQPILTGGGHDIRLVSKGKFTDIAYDGVYMESGNAYEPLPKMSNANWVFVIISLAAIILGGAIPSACAVGGAAAGAAIALNKSLGNKTKIVIGALIAALTWALAIGLSFFFVKGIKLVEKNTAAKFGLDEYSIELTRDFRKDNDTEGLLEAGDELVFAVYSDEVYAFATKISESQLKLIYDVELASAEEYFLAYFDIDKSDIKRTESGREYITYAEGERRYVISVEHANKAFYFTQLQCLEKNAEKCVPKMIEWTNSIKITDSEG